MKLYFGNTAATVTTLMIAALIAFVAFTVINRADIQYWGRRSAVLFIFGLVVCCFAAARDGLDKTIQNAVDGSCRAGIFPLVSIPNIIGCIGALIIITAAVSTPAAKTEHAREIWFYIMSGGALMKIAAIEISRLLIG